MKRQVTTLVVLIAPPGSGKGTLSELLRERDGFFVLSAGKTFRKLISESQDKKFEEVNKGKYLSDEIVNGYMIKELEQIRKEALKSNKENIYISLDGYPRTLGQAYILEEWAKDKELVIVRLEGLSEEQISKRLNNRYLCEANEHIFNFLGDFPKDGKCPKDGSKLVKRKDDLEIEIIKKRLSQHDSLTFPIWEYFLRKKCRSLSLNSDLSIEELYSSFWEKLRS